jgi:hypothetical protein
MVVFLYGMQSIGIRNPAHSIIRSTGVIVEGKKERKAEAQAQACAMLKDIHFTPNVEDLAFVDYLENF